jgi:hypothetical protein
MAFAVPVALITYSQLFIADKVAAHYVQAVLIGLIGLDFNQGPKENRKRKGRRMERRQRPGMEMKRNTRTTKEGDKDDATQN